jgi:hypothetical protein
MPRTKARGTSRSKGGLDGLTSDYAVRERTARAAMTPKQRKDYVNRGRLIGAGLASIGVGLAGGAQLAGAIGAARVAGLAIGSAASAFAIGSNPGRAIAPGLPPKPAPKKVVPAVRRPGSPIAR